MNDEFSDLENELRRLHPVPPSGALEQRIAAALAGTQPEPLKSNWWQRLGFARPSAALIWGVCSPLASAAAVLFFISSAATSPWPIAPVHAAVATLPPTAASNVVYQASDEGIVLAGDQTPLRRLRYRSEDTLAWRNPQTGSQWEVSYPREDVFLLPIKAE